MIAIIFLCITKSHPFAMFVRNFTTTSLSIAEILLFIKKMVENLPWPTLPINACVMLTYARQYRCQCTVRQRLGNFCINKNKVVA